MKRSIYLLTLISITVLFACKSKKQVTATHSHEFEKPITLAIGDSATFEDGLVFRLLRVTSDSRCPKGANCVWAGEVVAVFNANDEEELTISSDPLKNPVKLGAYFIEFTGASPEKTDAKIAQADYRLTFNIKKPVKP